VYLIKAPVGVEITPAYDNRDYNDKRRQPDDDSPTNSVRSDLASSTRCTILLINNFSESRKALFIGETSFRL
jgi:hypothetical protein